MATLSKIPSLIMFGDHLGDVHLADVNVLFSWLDALNSCNAFVDQLKKAGGDAEMMYLPALGIKGNSHMLMQDKNSNQLADLLITWIDHHVEAKRSGAH